jgi:hypothetical protein
MRFVVELSGLESAVRWTFESLHATIGRAVERAFVEFAQEMGRSAGRTFDRRDPPIGALILPRILRRGGSSWVTSHGR